MQVTYYPNISFLALTVWMWEHSQGIGGVWWLYLVRKLKLVCRTSPGYTRPSSRSNSKLHKLYDYSAQFCSMHGARDWLHLVCIMMIISIMGVWGVCKLSGKSARKCNYASTVAVAAGGTSQPLKPVKSRPSSQTLLLLHDSLLGTKTSSR